VGREAGNWEGKRTEALRASRKNGNRQLQEVGGWGIFDDMPFSGERELVKPTFSRKTEHQVLDEVATPQSKL